MAMTSGPANPLFYNPVAFLCSAYPSGQAGWGVHITYPLYIHMVRALNGEKRAERLYLGT